MAIKKNIKKSSGRDREAPPENLDVDIVEEKPGEISKPIDSEDRPDTKKATLEDSLISGLNQEQQSRSTRSSALAVSLSVSIIVGLGAGLVGSLYLPGLLGLSGSSNRGNPAEVKTVVLDEDSAIVDVVERANPAVVSIIVNKDLPKVEQFFFNPFGEDEFFMAPFEFSVPTDELESQVVGAGSGFIVSPDGVIVTNKHVVSDDNADYTVITKNGDRYPAQVLARDPLNDIAIVKIEASDLATLEFGDSDKVQLGSRVIAIGNTLGELRNTVTSGIVSGIGRTITAGDRLGSVQQLDSVFQTDAAINPGNSGGPLLNLAGQVIGINTAIDQSGQLVGFSIPANEARKALEDTLTHGRILRPYIGVRYVIINKSFAQANSLTSDHGALIVAGGSGEAAVVAGSPAADAGLIEDDIITEINGQAITEEEPLLRRLKAFNPGDEVVLTIDRDGEEKEILLELGELQ